MKERSAQVEEKRLPSVLIPSSPSSRESSVHIHLRREAEREKERRRREESVDLRFLYIARGANVHPRRGGTLRILKGRPGLRGLSFLLLSPLIYSGAQLFPSIDAIKNKSRPEDRVSASPI